MEVSWNRGAPKSSILMGFSLINHASCGTSILETPHMPMFMSVDQWSVLSAIQELVSRPNHIPLYSLNRVGFISSAILLVVNTKWNHFRSVNLHRLLHLIDICLRYGLSVSYISINIRNYSTPHFVAWISIYDHSFPSFDQTHSRDCKAMSAM